MQLYGELNILGTHLKLLVVPGDDRGTAELAVHIECAHLALESVPQLFPRLQVPDKVWPCVVLQESWESRSGWDVLSSSKTLNQHDGITWVVTILIMKGLSLSVFLWRCLTKIHRIPKYQDLILHTDHHWIRLRIINKTINNVSYCTCSRKAPSWIQSWSSAFSFSGWRAFGLGSEINQKTQVC